jgi:hypothetical protein
MNKLLLWSFLWLAPAVHSEILYKTDFTRAEPGKVPEELQVLEGAFTVHEDQGNRFLELPGAPVDAFTVLFGPAESSNVVVTARIQATARGRRSPTFGVGLNGVAGYRLQVSPAKNAIELYKDRELKATTPYEWKSGQWFHCRLQLRNRNQGWTLEGKVWPEGTPEPERSMIAFDENEEPLPGRASIFGNPFSGTPIRFDDLIVTRPDGVRPH